jgi:hypothetical protein
VIRYSKQSKLSRGSMAHELHAVVGVVPKKVTDAGLIYAWQTTNITDVIL